MKSSINIVIVAGARPNFMKIAPIIHAINDNNNKKNSVKIKYRLVHTGQHFDDNMSQNFFRELKIPAPDINLNCGGVNQAELTAKIIIEFQNYLSSKSPDLVIVVGDVTSTMACAIVARKLKFKVAHVEAGIRSYDWKMPEEINRVVTDSISNFFFTTTISASNNLINSGVDSNDIFFVGNTMIDTLKSNINKLKQPLFWDKENISKNQYVVLTLHRPSNVDEQNLFEKILKCIIDNSFDYKIIFPVHPRTKKILDLTDIKSKNLVLVNPLSYLEFNYLVKNCKAVITDSGGITEEATYMKIPCITIRENTERPETVEIGTNILVGNNLEKLAENMRLIFDDKWKKSSIPSLWDGKTSKRIIKKIIDLKNEDRI